MTDGIKVDVTLEGNMVDNLDNALDNLQKSIEGRVAKRSVQQLRTLATNQAPYRTGQLKQAIKTTKTIVERKGEYVTEFGISVNLPYAIPVEYGTGNLGDPGVPHTAKTHWRYQAIDKTGQLRWYTGHPRKAKPYMRPSMERIKPYVEQELKRAVDKALTGGENDA